MGDSMTEFRNTNFGLEVAKGNIPGHSIVHKFGNAPDFDTSDGVVDVWDGASDGGSDLMSLYLFSYSGH